MSAAQQILNDISGNVVVIDEKWLYAKPHPNQHNVRAWGDSARDRPKLPRTTMSVKKFHIIIGVTFRAQNYYEVLNAGETVNSQRYVAFLQNILQLRRQGLTIMHDNARPHVSQLTSAFMENNNIAGCINRHIHQI